MKIATFDPIRFDVMDNEQGLIIYKKSKVSVVYSSAVGR